MAPQQTQAEGTESASGASDASDPSTAIGESTPNMSDVTGAAAPIQGWPGIKVTSEYHPYSVEWWNLSQPGEPHQLLCQKFAK